MIIKSSKCNFVHKFCTDGKFINSGRSGVLRWLTLKFFCGDSKSVYNLVGFVGQLCESISTDLVFIFIKRPTSVFLLCRSIFHINAPDFCLSFHYRNRPLVGFVGQKQTSLSGGVV